MSAIIIEVDEYKNRIRGYDPAQSHLVHAQSGKLADIDFKKALKLSEYKKVVLMCGGSASGKSEYVSSTLADEQIIVYDGTLANIQGAEVKIRNSKRKNKEVEIHAIITDNIYKSFAASLVRERKLPYNVFINTHIGCRKTILEILKSKIQVEVRIFESHLEKDKLMIEEVIFDSHEKKLEFINNKQITKEEILGQMTP